MNLCIPISEISKQNIYFTEKRKNIIIDGFFSKIIFSNEYISLNGLYIIFDKNTNTHTESEIKTEEHKHKNTSFNHFLLEQIPYTDIICQLEHDILEHYKTFYDISKNYTCSLKTQLTSSHFYFGELPIKEQDAYSSHGSNPIFIKTFGKSASSIPHTISTYKITGTEEKLQVPFNKNTYNCLKISGIWENSTSFGITYKWVYFTPFHTHENV